MSKSNNAAPDLKKKEDKQKAIAISIASSVASIIAKFLTHPIDTVKAKLQVSRMEMRTLSDIRLGNAIEIAKKTYRNQGIPGFFRGVTISALGSTIAFSCYMSVYEYSKRKMSQKQSLKGHPTFIHLMSGFLAEMGSCAFWLPIDIIKERLQVQSQLDIYKYKGPRDAAKKIHISQGLIGLYRAYGATLLFFGPFSAIFFATFQKMKDLFVKQRKKPTLMQSIVCSSAAAAIAGYITTPLQVVKLRMQIQRADVATHGGSLQNSVFGYRNAFHGLYTMLQKQGFFALFKGGFIRICFTIPITSISMSLTQLFKQQILQRRLLESWI